jgi:hypothetical protein
VSPYENSLVWACSRHQRTSAYEAVQPREQLLPVSCRVSSQATIRLTRLNKPYGEPGACSKPHGTKGAFQYWT